MSTQFIPGPSGQIELVLEGDKNASTVGIICHPHPLFGGTMNNKVVTTTTKALQQLGLATVRFNFRGIGKSTGTYGEGCGELQDLLAVLDWVKTALNPTTYWLAGFSFGSHIAFQASLQWSCAQLITIAPPIARFDFTQANDIHCPWLLIQGDQDDVVSPKEVFDWAKTMTVPVEVICIKDAGHFFHGKLIELRDAIITSLHTRV